MKLDPKGLALAAAITTGVVWIICSALVAALPGRMMGMTGYMVHADFGQTNWTMNSTGFLVGLIVWTLAIGATAWLFATLHNRLVR